jgi:ribosomal-protein-serine acetyltransferase
MAVGTAREDILIRPLKADDAGAMLAAITASMPTLSQWLPWATPAYARADAAEWIAHCLRSREADNEYHFGVFDVTSGEVLGGVGLNHRIRAYRTAHMGYWVADTARGRGVAVEAARQAENRASLRVAVKLGAVCEGVARNGIIVDGEPHEAIVHSLVPDDLHPDDLRPCDPQQISSAVTD